MITDTTPKILLVDDDPSSRNLMPRFLNHKYQVYSAADGETGLALFEKLSKSAGKFVSM